MWNQWKQLPTLFTKTESRVVRGAFGVIVLSLLFLGGAYASNHRVEIPTIGGEYTEGFIGDPQLINPLYAPNNDVDADLVRLIYSGLLAWDETHGLIPDLAEEWHVSDDKKTYTFTIKNQARFHDGEEVRAADVLFTVSAIQNPAYRSPLASSFQKVKAEQVDDKTVSFQLEEPSAVFPFALTVGILPANHWGDILPQNAPLAALNLQPIGTGPYRFVEFSKEKKGAIRSYTLERFPDFYNTPALIKRLTFKFYPDQESAVVALEEKHIEGIGFVDYASLSRVEEQRSANLLRPFMPRAVVLYFNQEANPLLQSLPIRNAIGQSIDKAALVETLHHGFARVLSGPLVGGMMGFQENPSSSYAPENARTLLDEAGYVLPEGSTVRAKKQQSSSNPETPSSSEPTTPKQEELRFTLTTIQSKEFIDAAELIQQSLADVGIAADIDAVESDAFFSSVLEPKAFELLLTGLLYRSDGDPYLFWHSSQKIFPGLNIAQYANPAVDTLLLEARKATTDDVRREKYQTFEEQIFKDIPAVFLYQSTYAYAISKKIQRVEMMFVNTPADRFANITEWYIKTKKTLK